MPTRRLGSTPLRTIRLAQVLSDRKKYHRYFLIKIFCTYFLLKLCINKTIFHGINNLFIINRINWQYFPTWKLNCSPIVWASHVRKRMFYLVSMPFFTSIDVKNINKEIPPWIFFSKIYIFPNNINTLFGFIIRENCWFRQVLSQI